MHFFSITLLAAAALAGAAPEKLSLRAESIRALESVFKRQEKICGSVPVGTPNPCEVACGAGYQICISAPTCYNPTQGDTCCSDGTYCRSGEYCTNGGCCPKGVSLAECGATETLSTIAPTHPSTPEKTQQSSATHVPSAPAPSITPANSSEPTAASPTIAIGEGIKAQAGTIGVLLSGFAAAILFF